ncbi:MAG: type IV toxin-antitoxin system AbiEi family antitoxin domain-containing protein [Burkholderiaceae bacterium]|jgi:hypothetical protein|nr:type IV toxin-antitoxin system AbiEi family antitoxin domain-containing protein [Burkholderiaceae bacterium]MCP5286437.1 type IV toxin-antitoxin system AbiEi family antitoxin domain-containing protein [Burkholderiaceae bacterium]
MGSSPSLLFRQALASLPRGAPLSTRLLQEQGLSAKQVVRLAEGGWLRRLGRGVYLLPGDELNRDAALAWLGTQVPGLHVAGKTALGWRGVRHNLAFKERLVLWGDVPTTLPDWFTDVFPAAYQATHLFDNTLPAAVGLAPLPGGRADLLVSAPERAVLELLSDIGKSQGLEEARHLVEGARSLRMDIMDTLLGHLKRIKVARLAHAFADDLGLPWSELARRHSERLGGGRRWVSATKTGERLNLKRPS